MSFRSAIGPALLVVVIVMSGMAVAFPAPIRGAAEGEPTIRLGQASAVIGETIRVRGQFFPGSTDGVVSWEPDGSVLGSFTTRDGGSFEVDVVMPAGPPGRSEVRATVGDVTAVAQIRLVEGATATSVPGTDTPVPPTDTATNPPTDTPEPPTEPPAETATTEPAQSTDTPEPPAEGNGSGTTPTSPSDDGRSADRSTLTVAAVADAWVEIGNPDRNAGGVSSLKVDGTPDPEVWSFLQFEVSGVDGALASARLRLYVTASSEDGPLVGSATNAWAEREITWNNRPPLTSGAVDDLGQIREGTWVELDVTSLVTGDGLYTLVLIPTSMDGADFVAREGSNRQPELLLEVDGAGDPAPSPTSTSATASAVAAPSDTATTTTTIDNATTADSADVSAARTTDAQGRPTCTLTPASAEVGDDLTMRCSRFGPRERVAVTWDGAPATTLTTDGSGAGAVSLVVPRSTAGLHTVRLRGAESGGTNTKRVTVVPSNGLSPRTAAPGTTVRVTLRGFGAGEVVALRFRTAPGSSRTLTSGIVASRTGTAAAAVVVPAGPAGRYTMEAVGGSGGFATSPFTRTAPPDVATATVIPTGTATRTPVSDPERQTVVVSADARVEQANASTNFGADASLRIDGGSHPVHSYLRFVVSGLAKPAQSVTLRVYATSSSLDGPLLYACDASWTERGITWANRPPLLVLIGDKGKVNRGAWLEYDVSQVVTGNGTYCFALVGATDDGVWFDSREDGATSPQLAVGGGESPSPTTPMPIDGATATAVRTPTASRTPTATRVASPTASPTGDFGPPIRAAFYYPWFPEAWSQKGISPYTNYVPSNGYYDGSDAAVIAEHIEAMQYGKIDAGIASWWGQGHRTDARFPLLLSTAAGTGFEWAAYYEPESQGDPSVSQLRQDLTYLRDRYANDPAYLRVDGKFVLFVYSSGGDSCGMVDRWEQANTVDAYIVLKVFSGYQTCQTQPDHWHQYAPANAVNSIAGESYSISPGFWLAGEGPRLDRNLARWQQSIRDMVASGAPFQLVISFNEWGEGTIVESAEEWDSPSGYGSYMDALHNDGAGPGGASTPTPTSTRSPSPVSGSDPVLLAAGDIAGCNSTGDEATADLLDGLDGTIAILGDIAYESGTTSEFADCFDPSWGRHRDRTRPAVGNHEYLTTNAGPYFDYFGAAAGDPTKGYYAYTLGEWQIIVLNSQCSKVKCDPTSAQYAWLQAQLAANPASCTLAYFHHPVFSSGQHGNTPGLAPLWNLLYAGGAEVVLTGHDHVYERFAPMDGSGAYDPTYGVRQFVVGTGGKNHTAFRNVLANSEVREANTFGILKLTLHAGAYDWRFVPEAGKTFSDAGTGRCHGKPPVAETAGAGLAVHDEGHPATIAEKPIEPLSATFTGTVITRRGASRRLGHGAPRPTPSRPVRRRLLPGAAVGLSAPSRSHVSTRRPG